MGDPSGLIQFDQGRRSSCKYHKFIAEAATFSDST